MKQYKDSAADPKTGGRVKELEDITGDNEFRVKQETTTTALLRKQEERHQRNVATLNDEVS